MGDFVDMEIPSSRMMCKEEKKKKKKSALFAWVGFFFFFFSHITLLFIQERIASLTASIQRLKLKEAADVGDREAFEFYTNTNNELALVDSLREKLK